MGQEAFDIAAVHRIVDAALGDHLSPRAASHGAVLGVGETRLLTRIAQALGHYCTNEQRQQVLNDIRRSAATDLTPLPDVRYQHQMIRRCRRCPLMTPEPQTPIGNLTDPKVLFLADGPMVEADSTWLVAAAQQAGFARDDLAITFLTRCVPTERRSPSTTELTNCVEYLGPEIEVLNPQLVLTLGSAVLTTLIGDVKITDVHGRIFWLGARPILPLFGIGYSQRSEREQVFANDLQTAYTFCVR